MNNSNPPNNQTSITKKEAHLLFLLILIFTAIQLIFNLEHYLVAIPNFVHVMTSIGDFLKHLF